MSRIYGLVRYFLTDKHRLTQVSLLITLVLVVFKVIAAITSGSISITAEAINNASDIFTSLIAMLAVRLSDKPADDNHPYGHGKIESLGALVTVGFLGATYIGVIYRAVGRLAVPEPLDNAILPLAAVSLSIGINIFRQWWFTRAARQYRSQALAAEALNFRMDLISSGVTMVALFVAGQGSGLLGGGNGWRVGSNIAQLADPLGAILVSLIALIFAAHLVKHAVDVLLDRAPLELTEKIAHMVTSTPNVAGLGNVRVREVGTRAFIDLTVAVPRTLSLEASHDVATLIEHRAHEIVPEADVLVHVEPVADINETLVDRIRTASLRTGKAVHNVNVYTIGDVAFAQLDLEVSPELNLQSAHLLAHDLEVMLRHEFALAHVSIHIEPIQPISVAMRAAHVHDKDHLLREVKHLAYTNRDVRRIHNLVLDQVDNVLNLALDFELSPHMPLAMAHAIAEKFEHDLRTKLPKLGRVSIHTEPHGAEDVKVIL